MRAERDCGRAGVGAHLAMLDVVRGERVRALRRKRSERCTNLGITRMSLHNVGAESFRISLISHWKILARILLWSEATNTGNP